MTFEIRRIAKVCLEAAEKFITRKINITLLHSCNFYLLGTTHKRSHQNEKKYLSAIFAGTLQNYTVKNIGEL